MTFTTQDVLIYALLEIERIAGQHADTDWASVYYYANMGLNHAGVDEAAAAVVTARCCGKAQLWEVKPLPVMGGNNALR